MVKIANISTIHKFLLLVLDFDSKLQARAIFIVHDRMSDEEIVGMSRLHLEHKIEVSKTYLEQTHNVILLYEALQLGVSSNAYTFTDHVLWSLHRWKFEYPLKNPRFIRTSVLTTSRF